MDAGKTASLRAVLGDAHSRARDSDDLTDSSDEFQALVTNLYAEDVMVTYLSVLAAALLARIQDPTVDVKNIKAKTGGYAAATNAKVFVEFAQQQGVNVRTTSTGPMQAQPFQGATYLKSDLTESVGYREFLIPAVDLVNEMSPEQALSSLITVFRVAQGFNMILTSETGVLNLKDLHEARRVLEVIATFVSENIEGGKVGQAFAAASLDCIFPNERVTMKKVNDPSKTSPGDVTVGSPIWMALEARQRLSRTEEAATFISRCANEGIYRVVRFDLVNSRYPDSPIDRKTVDALQDRADVLLFDSPEASIEWVMNASAGEPPIQTMAIVRAFERRLQEIGVSPETLRAFIRTVNPPT